jgi:putative ABC transport system permease protein
MRTLDRKLFRELRRHWVQITSIALVMGCGTMTIMGLRSTLTSIRAARDDYFDAYRFGDVFAHLERAPDAVAQRITRIRGVGAIETRIVRDVRLDVPGLSEPAIGHMVSIPAVRRSMLNELLIRRGRWIAPGSPREVLVSDRFAEVNHLAPGDSLSAVINGRWERLEIVGVAISPEFVVEYAGSGLFVDNRRYGIVWASSELVENAFDMKGAFNDVVIRVASATAEARVRSDLDALLEPWGGAPSFGRKDQPAARVLEDEFSQLRTNATIFPLFFLFVAAFLLNVVLSRLVASQREEIAALKAFGYTDREIGWHYLGFGIAAVVLGAAVGIPAGAWMGARFSRLYQDYFRFPSIPSVIDWGAVGVGVGVSGGFALLGALSGVRRVMRLTPAEALRPEAPSRFRVAGGANGASQRGASSGADCVDGGGRRARGGAARVGPLSVRRARSLDGGRVSPRAALRRSGGVHAGDSRRCRVGASSRRRRVGGRTVPRHEHSRETRNCHAVHHDHRHRARPSLSAGRRRWP